MKLGMIAFGVFWVILAANASHGDAPDPHCSTSYVTTAANTDCLH